MAALMAAIIRPSRANNGVATTNASAIVTPRLKASRRERISGSSVRNWRTSPACAASSARTSDRSCHRDAGQVTYGYPVVYPEIRTRKDLTREQREAKASPSPSRERPRTRRPPGGQPHSEVLGLTEVEMPVREVGEPEQQLVAWFDPGDGQPGLHVVLPRADFAREHNMWINPITHGHIAWTVDDIEDVKQKLQQARRLLRRLQQLPHEQRVSDLHDGPRGQCGGDQPTPGLIASTPPHERGSGRRTAEASLRSARGPLSACAALGFPPGLRKVFRVHRARTGASRALPTSCS